MAKQLHICLEAMQAEVSNPLSLQQSEMQQHQLHCRASHQLMAVTQRQHISRLSKQPIATYIYTAYELWLLSQEDIGTKATE